MKGYTFIHNNVKHEIISEPLVIRSTIEDGPDYTVVFIRNCQNGLLKKISTDFIKGPIDKVK